MNQTSWTTASVWSLTEITVSTNSSRPEHAWSELESQSVTLPGSKNGLLKNMSSPVTWDSSADCHVVSYYFHFFVGLFVSSVAAFAITGNILVLCTYSRYSSLRTTSNLFIINLTIADLIMSFLNFPMFAASSFNGCWLLGYTGCQFYGFTTSIFSLVTINTLAVISVDRYLAVVYRLSPMYRMRKSTTGLIILFIWLLSLVWSVLPLVGIGAYRLEGLGTSCTFNYIDRSYSQRGFFISLVVFNFFIPMLVIIVCYSRIFNYVKRVKQELRSLQSAEQNSVVVRKRTGGNAELKTAVAVLLIISVFCIAWTPYVIVAFVGLFGTEDSITPIISVFPNILAKVCTVSNPILYTIGQKDLRQKLKALLFSRYSKSSSFRATYTTAGASMREHSDVQELAMNL